MPILANYEAPPPSRHLDGSPTTRQVNTETAAAAAAEVARDLSIWYVLYFLFSFWFY
jgi:hypothetical protein